MARLVCEQKTSSIHSTNRFIRHSWILMWFHVSNRSTFNILSLHKTEQFFHIQHRTSHSNQQKQKKQTNKKIEIKKNINWCFQQFLKLTSFAETSLRRKNSSIFLGFPKRTHLQKRSWRKKKTVAFFWTYSSMNKEPRGCQAIIYSAGNDHVGSSLVRLSVHLCVAVQMACISFLLFQSHHSSCKLANVYWQPALQCINKLQIPSSSPTKLLCSPFLYLRSKGLWTIIFAFS